MSIADKLTTIAANEQKVYEAGKDKEWSDFWDALQKNGKRTSYAYAFVDWQAPCFKPKYDIKPTNCTRIFYNFATSANPYPSVCKCLEDAGVVFDTSKSTNVQYLFWYAYNTDCPVISTVSADNVDSIFAVARYMETVEKLILKDDGSQTLSNSFSQCYALKNIVIEGVIGNNVDMSACPLSKASFTSVINALSSTTTGKTASFKKSAKEAAFTADEWAALIATKTNWTISLI